MLSCGVSFFAVDEIVLCLSIGSQQWGATALCFSQFSCSPTAPVMFCNIIVPCWFCGLLSRDDRVQTMLLNETKKKKKKSRILRRSWIFPFDFQVRNSHDLHQKTMIETRHMHSAVVFEKCVVADRNSCCSCWVLRVLRDKGDSLCHRCNSQEIG
jgi:hypothetical protein